MTEIWCIGTAVLSAGAKPVAVAIEPQGRFLYVAEEFGERASVFRFDPSSGPLTRIQSLGLTAPVSLAVKPTGRFLCVASRENDMIFALRVNPSTGLLTFVETDFLAEPRTSAHRLDPSVPSKV